MPDEQFFFRTRTVFGLNPPSLAKGESRRVSTRKRTRLDFYVSPGELGNWTRTHLGLSPGGPTKIFSAANFSNLAISLGWPHLFERRRLGEFGILTAKGSQS